MYSKGTCSSGIGLELYVLFHFKVKKDRAPDSLTGKILYLCIKMKLDKIQIRETTFRDFEAIMEVERSAFGNIKEAKLVSSLLVDKSADPRISLLAFYKKEAIGHILFTKAHISGVQEQPLIHILAPLAVKPDYQKQGVGGMLIKAGLQILKEKGSKLVFVLGHKEYYPRHGFIQNAQGMGFFAPYPDPMPDEYADYWMVQPLTQDGLDGIKGKINCADTLNRPEYWRE